MDRARQVGLGRSGPAVARAQTQEIERRTGASDAQVAKRTVKSGGQIARSGAPVASPVTPMIRCGDKRVEAL